MDKFGEEFGKEKKTRIQKHVADFGQHFYIYSVDKSNE